MAYVSQALLTLGVLVLIAFALWWVTRKSGPRGAVGPIELAGRLPLDPRRAIYLVRVHDRVFIVAGSETGLTKLGEIPGENVPRLPLAPSALQRLVRSATGVASMADSASADEHVERRTGVRTTPPTEAGDE